MKNSVFNFKRFGTCLLNDLRIAKNQFGLSMIILGLLPAISFFLFTLMLKMVTDDMESFRNFYSTGAFMLGTFVAVLAFPVKVYSRVASRKLGSGFILLPASTLEKFLSMLVVSLVAMPLAFMCVFCLCDGIMSLLFNSTYGDLLVGNFFKFVKFFKEEQIADPVYLRLAVGLVLSGFASGILTYLLGSVVFRTQPLGKTILACILIGIVFSIIGVEGYINADLYELSYTLDDDMAGLEAVMRRFFTFGYLSNGVTICALLGGIYYRIKTIQY